MTKFVVLDNGRPAKYPDCLVPESWNNHEFASFNDAKNYAREWLGLYEDIVDFMKLNTPIEYTGYGDTLEIRETTT